MTIEKDPHGKLAGDSGAKLDAGKPICGRVLMDFANALMAVSEVGTFGAVKYRIGDWQNVPNGFARYEDAQMRHMLKRGAGEEIDDDSQLPHIYQEAWNCLAKLELYIREQKKEINK